MWYDKPFWEDDWEGYWEGYWEGGVLIFVPAGGSLGTRCQDFGVDVMRDLGWLG
jgi:hypothetical protein